MEGRVFAVVGGRCSESISRPHGRSVGLPKSSWLNQLPMRPMPCASSRPGATASMNERGRSRLRGGRSRRRRGTPSRIPPQTPRPPFQTANDALPLRVGHLVPARDVVVERARRRCRPRRPRPRRGSTRSRSPPAPHPAHAGQPDAGRDREQQHQPVHVDRQRAEVERAAARRGMKARKLTGRTFCPCGRRLRQPAC